MNNRPKVSVVVITYNQEDYIRETLDSIAMQKTDFPFEVVVADDCSTDRTPAIVQEFSKNYPGVFKPIVRTKNIGAAKNSVSAMQAAKGDYIALCEGDDYWTDPHKLQIQADYLDKHPKYALCFHPVRVVFESKDFADYTTPSTNDEALFTREELLERNYIQTNSVMYRRQNYDALPTDILPLDWYYHLYHAKYGKIGFIDKVMSVYRRHAGGIWWGSYGDNDHILQKHGVAWLGLYVEVLKLYESDKAARKLLEGSIITMFNSLARVDKQYHKNLVRQAVSRYPEQAEIYILDLIKQAKMLDEHSKKQAEIMDHLSKTIQGKEQEIQQLRSQNTELDSKMLVRLERGVKRRAKRALGRS